MTGAPLAARGQLALEAMHLQRLDALLRMLAAKKRMLEALRRKRKPKKRQPSGDPDFLWLPWLQGKNPLMLDPGAAALSQQKKGGRG